MVKLAVTFVFTAALAIATVRAQEAGAETVEEVLARDVSSSESDLFGRAAAKVMNDLFSREELSEVYGRDFDGDLTWRDVTELVERESIDMSEIEELAARAAAPQQSPDAPAPPKNHEHDHKNHDHKSVFGQVLSFFNRLIHPKPKTGDHHKGKGEHAPAHGEKAAHKGDKGAHKEDKAAHKAEKAPAKDEHAPPKEDAPEGGAEEAREFLEEPVERSLEDEIDLAARDFLSDDEALEVRGLLDTAELELEARDILDAALELEVRELLDNAELELLERDFEEDLLERDVEDDLLERDFEEDLLERDFEEDLLEREIGDEWDDELLRRAFDIVEELEMLD